MLWIVRSYWSKNQGCKFNGIIVKKVKDFSHKINVKIQLRVNNSIITTKTNLTNIIILNILTNKIKTILYNKYNYNNSKLTINKLSLLIIILYRIIKNKKIINWNRIFIERLLSKIEININCIKR